MGELRKQSIDMERWVCPNDRQLALRAKLGAGWSVHTNKQVQVKKAAQLSEEEQEQIMNVIMRADMLEQVEQERIGRLVEKLDNMKKNAMGDGAAQCILCGDAFGMLGASPTYCDDCKKAVCTKCGIDTFNSNNQPLWLCKICSENRELWKRSGAWFFKGLPKYTMPSKRGSKYTSCLGKTGKTGRGHVGRGSYNTWNTVRDKHHYNDSSEQETTSGSEDDEVSIGRHKHRPVNESDGVSVRSESTSYDHSDYQRSVSSEYIPSETARSEYPDRASNGGMDHRAYYDEPTSRRYDPRSDVQHQATYNRLDSTMSSRSAYRHHEAPSRGAYDRQQSAPHYSTRQMSPEPRDAPPARGHRSDRPEPRPAPGSYDDW